MNLIELEILEACQEAEQRRLEMLPPLAATLEIPEKEVFYAWAFRKPRQRGKLLQTPWTYFFHGLECDLQNPQDGRYLRFDFGPGGRVDTMTAWGVLQFIMTSVAPWSEFPSLKQHFAKTEPPYDELSGDFHRFCEYWDRLEQQGCFEPADPQFVEFMAQHTSIGEDGLRRIAYPPGTPERKQADCSVAHRVILSARARELLAKQLSRK